MQAAPEVPIPESTSGKSAKPQKLIGIHETTKVRDYLALQEKANGLSWGNAMFIEFGHRYLRPFVVKDQPLQQIISDCVYCICFVGFWRRDIMMRSGTLKEGHKNGRFAKQKKSGASAAAAAARKSKINMKENFMTMELMNDVLISCQMLILDIIMFGKKHPKVKFEAGRFSSRFSEYTFQQLRAATKTSNKLCAYQYTHIARAVMSGLEVASCKGSAMLPPRQGKRGVENSVYRCDEMEWGNMPDGYYPTEAEVHAACVQVSCWFGA